MLDKVAVVGAGSWGTTVATIAARSARTASWARQAWPVDAVNARRESPDDLPGVVLRGNLRVRPA